jgi:hypothetical protein
MTNSWKSHAIYLGKSHAVFLRKRLPPKGALKPITSGSAYFEIRVVLSQLAERNLRESV